MAIAASPIPLEMAKSRLRRLKNGVPQGSVLAPLLFNKYISDLPTTVSRKYAYADDLVIIHVDGDSNPEYCAPVWCRSADNRLIDPAINNALRIVTGCLRPTPPDNLSILAGIQPAELLCNGATLSLARRAMEPRHLLHAALTCPPSANARCLKSRHQFVRAAQ